jgi:hypothetical protein
MNTTWIRTLMLSTAVLTMGSAAYGQSHLTAEIPFSFRINGTELPAGKYSVDRANVSTKNVVELNNGKGVKLALGHTAYGDEDKQARLIFSCRDGSGCTLVQAWYDHGFGLEFNKPKPTGADNERMAVVIVLKSQAD